MDIEYRRDMNHNYMIVKRTGADVPDDYETRVISANRIPGLLTCSMQYIDAEIWYSYDVTSLQKLTVFCESRKIGKGEIVKILSEILRILEGLEDYLLDFQHLVLMPSCVCMDFDTMEIRLMYVPFFCKDIRSSLRELTEYLLGCADHSDQSAIVLGYRFCHEVQENNTQLGDLMGVLYGKDRSGAGSPAGETVNGEPEIRLQYFEKEQSEAESCGVLPGIRADDLGERGANEESGTYPQSRSEKGKRGKRIKERIPGRPAVIAVFTGLLILAALFVFLHTDLLRYISIYTICGICAGVCAVILAAYLIRERRGNKRDIREERRREKPEEQRKLRFEKEAADDMPLLPDAVEGDSGMPERSEVPTWDQHEDLPVTALLSSYRPARGPEDRWLLPKSEGLPKIHLTGNDILIGKNQQYANVIINSPAVSRIHARLRFRAGRYFVADLSSRNGTTVNGEAVCGEEERVLSEGDVITFADATYIFSTTEKGADCESGEGGV
jgi:hypothetical protein